MPTTREGSRLDLVRLGGFLAGSRRPGRGLAILARRLPPVAGAFFGDCLGGSG